MKRYLRFLAVTAAAMLLCIGLLVYAAAGKNRGSSIPEMNDIVQTVRANRDHPEALAQTPYGKDLLVFGSEGNLIYPADTDTGIDSPLRAAENGYICMAVTEQNIFLGTAAFPPPDLSGTQRMLHRLILAAALIFLMTLVILAAVGLYVYRNIIRPFRQMKAFAGNIATGRLDEPLLMEQNNLFGTFTESFDLMRDALRESRDREAALKSREKELIASLSHDMKTPVTGIKLLCELLTVKTEDAYVRSKVENIGQKAEQLNLLVSDLLTSALDDLGEMHVSCQDQDSAVLHTLLSEHDTRSLVREEPVPECLICADRRRLSQVIANIISNSYKYANTEIDVRYSFTERFLQMDITDHGGGIPQDELEHITSKFYRGKSNSGGKEGSGLGLYISRMLMQKMNGALHCADSADGLTVSLLIPLS